VKIELVNCVNHGEFLQVFADVTGEGGIKRVAFCCKSLPFTEGGVFNALACKYDEPPAPVPEKTEKVETAAVQAEPVQPDPARVARVKILENTYKALVKTAKTEITLAGPIVEEDAS
jgi:hypothetical protein